jgi:hypothetical protein
MTQRKGEVTLPDIKRHWPHQVALSADKVRGGEEQRNRLGFAATLSAAPRRYSLDRDDGDLCGVLLYKAARRAGVSRAIRW